MIKGVRTIVYPAQRIVIEMQAPNVHVSISSYMYACARFMRSPVLLP